MRIPLNIDKPRSPLRQASSLLAKLGAVDGFPAPFVAQGREVREALQQFLAGDEDRFRRLFLEGRSISASSAERPWMEILIRAGYVAKTLTNGFRPCLRVFFLDGLLIATDLLSHKSTDQVFSLMLEQVFLVRFMDVRQGDHVLELCLGSGVNAIASAKRGAARVVGVDVNERAIAFARANAAVNLREERGDVPLEILQGSLWEPLASGDRFDLILVNPPFELVPPGVNYFLHSHGGEDGLELVRKMLPSVRERLRLNGRFEMFTWSPGDADSEWVTELVLACFPGTRVEVRRVDRFPLDEVIHQFRNSPDYTAWRARLISAGVTYVWAVHIRVMSSEPGGLVRVSAADEVRACSATLTRWK